MAGSLLTVTEFSDEQIVLDWLSDDAAGNLSEDVISTYKTALAIAASSYLVVPDIINKMITGLEAIPGENGDLTTDVPSDLYDITVTNAYGTDLAVGELANLSSSSATKVTSLEPVSVKTEITINITNAGNSKKGRLIIYLK
jgi:hypothetical protein